MTSTERPALVHRLAEALGRTEGLLLVVTGAGMSAASGIPTFRGSDPEAVWNRDVRELGTLRYFLEAPALSWSWYLSRFQRVLEAQPNAGHRALVALEQRRERERRSFLLVTQNIDTLHEAAGARAVIKVHGSADRVRCAGEGCALGAPKGSLPRAGVDLSRFLTHPSDDNVPRCPACGDLLRQHVLWFDEYYQSHDDYRWHDVCSAVEKAERVLFCGTSFAVGVTDFVVAAGRRRGVEMFSIDPSGRAPSGVCALAAPAEDLLPATARALGCAGGAGGW